VHLHANLQNIKNSTVHRIIRGAAKKNYPPPAHGGIRTTEREELFQFLYHWGVAPLERLPILYYFFFIYIYIYIYIYISPFLSAHLHNHTTDFYSKKKHLLLSSNKTHLSLSPQTPKPPTSFTTTPLSSTASPSGSFNPLLFLLLIPT
jgi:hypothetical protein